MPSWKKVLISGSDAALNTLNVSTALTASGLIYPTSDGTSGQSLVTDGSGNLSFTTITSGGETGSLLVTASAAGSTITFEKGDGSTFNVEISSEVTPANALVTASLAGSVLTFEKGDTSTFQITLPAGGYSGSNATAHLNQTIAATTWSFAHNLDDRYPVFTVFNSAGDIIIPNRVETVDTNNANIYFTTARTGTATAVIASSISQIASVTANFTNETTVAVTHSLDTRNIHVSVYDTNYSLVVPESITLDTLDTVVVTFPSPQSGTVVVAQGGHIISGSAALATTSSYAEYAVTSSYAVDFEVANSLTASGLIYPTVDGTFGVEYIQTDALGNLSFEIPTTIYETVKNISGGPLVKGTPVHATGSGTMGNAIGVIAADALDPNKMPATYILNQNLADEEEGLGIAVGFINGVDTRGLIEGEVVYVAPGGGWTQTKPTGSALIQNLGIVTRVAENGSGVVLGAGRSNDVPNILQGYAWVGNADQVATATPTASFFVTSGSHALNADDAISASYASNAELLDGLNSSQFLRNDQSGTVAGDLTVTGIITAQEFHTEFVSASIIYQSGSTQFGNSSDDTHIFSGSVNIDGDVVADSFTGIFVGALSSSAQIASDISGSFISLSSSLEQRISPLEVSVSSLNSATSSYALASNISGAFASTSSSLSGRIAAQEQFSSSLSTTILVLSGSFSGSFVGDGSQLSGVTSYTDADTLDYINSIGVLSGSAQIASEISGAFALTSSSLAARIAAQESFSSSLNATFATDAELSAVSGALAASISSISTDFADITNKPTLISSSLQFNTLTTPFTGSFTGSFYGDGSNLSGVTSYTDADTLSFIQGYSGSYSGSFVGDGSQLSGVTSYTDADTLDYINSLGVVSGSAQINTGSFTGSFFGDGTGLTGLGYGDTKKLNQTVAATTWSFSHNMNEQYPTVTVYNSSNEVIQPSKIEGVDAQTLRLYFGVPTAGTAVAVVGGVALTQEAGFNRVFTQASTATTWSFEHNLGNKYPQIAVYDSNDELIIPGKVEAIDQNNAILYFDTAQSGVATATVGGTSLTASYANTLVVTDTLLSSQTNTDIDTGTETVATVSTTYYDGAFFDYVAKDGTNFRAGTVMAVWDGTSVQFNDNSTSDIGDTSGVTLSVDISGTDARLRAAVTTDNWTIKAFVRAL